MKNIPTKFLLKSFLILLIASIQSVVLAQTISLPAESASITFTNTVVTNNMSFVDETVNAGAEAYSEITTIGGVQCRKIPAGHFLYVGCTRAAIPTSQTNLLIAVTYYANSNNSTWFNYNGTSNNYQGADFEKNKSYTWATAIITITDGALAGLMNGGKDFRLGRSDEDNYIKEIKVYKGALSPTTQTVPTSPNSSISEFKNKSFAGYQIWHKAGSNAADWSHWAYGEVPSAGFHIHEDIASFPDISRFPNSDTYATGFANLGNGNPTRLYNDPDANIINRQMGWLQTAGVDGVAIQRFVGPIGKSVTITSESHLTNVKNACEATGRLFYICYDLNGTDATILQRMQTDWVYEIEQMRALTSSPNYATVNNKPVVELWGVGYNMATSTQCDQLITFLQARGCYVIGGTPNDWRTAPGAGFANVFKKLNAVSPWTIGIYNTIAGANNYLANNITPDKAYCTTNGMDYLPVVFAGAANWVNSDMTLSQTSREGGKFFWQQIVNAKNAGLTSVYLAMLDEFEESTNLIDGAVDYFDIPTDQYFETFAKDGVWTSSDYYLRLAARASKTLRGEVALSSTIEVPYSNGPIYFRNSFESRFTTIRTEGRPYDATLNIDPCFYNPSALSTTGITSPAVAIVNEPTFTKNGVYSAKATGTPNSASSASYYYQTSETKIAVKANMQLSFWKYSSNTLGQYTSVDLIFQSGKRLKDLAVYIDNNGNSMTPTIARGTVGSWQKFTCQIGTGQLIGDVITGIIIGYDHPSASGSYTAYFDDIIIEDAPANPNAPVISSTLTATGTVGTAFTYSITASNTPNGYTSVNLPTGLTINTTTGVISGTPTVSGSFSVTITASNTFGTDSKTLVLTISPISGQSPYLGTPWPIPGKIEAENYDEGGEGVAYHDEEATNKFNQFRTTEGVDAETTSDAGGGYNLGWISTGEWLEYSVDVQTAGTYNLQARMASGNAGTRTIRVYMDNVDISGAISFDASLAPNALGWQTFNTISVVTPVITTGTKIMKIAIEAGDFNMNYVNFTVATPLGIDFGNNYHNGSNTKIEGFSLYPNPVKAGGAMTLFFPKKESVTYHVRLNNQLGQNVYNSSIYVEGGISTYQLPLHQNLPTGHYQLELIGDDGTFSINKIIVQ